MEKYIPLPNVKQYSVLKHSRHIYQGAQVVVVVVVCTKARLKMAHSSAFIALFVFLAAVAPALGVVIEYSGDDTETNTTSTSYVEKLRHTYTASGANDYLVEWSAEVRTTLAKTCAKLRIQSDDTTTHNEVVFQAVPDAVDGWMLETGLFVLQSPASGPHDVDVDFSTSTAAEMVFVRNVRIIVTEF